MEVKIFEKLSEEARMIRTKVFMDEQGFMNEFDEIDDISIHIVLFESSEPVATCRIYYSKERQCYVIGRLDRIGRYEYGDKKDSSRFFIMSGKRLLTCKLRF